MISATKDDSYVSPRLEPCFLFLKYFLSTCDFHGHVFLRCPLKRELELTEDSLQLSLLWDLTQCAYQCLSCSKPLTGCGCPVMNNLCSMASPSPWFRLSQGFTAIWGSSYPTFWPTLSPFIGILSTSFSEVSLYLFLLPFLLPYIDILPNKSSHI